MFIFEQSIQNIFLMYMENNFEYNIESISGKRIENNNSTKISNGRNLFINNDIKLNFSNDYFKEIKNLLTITKNSLLKKNIHFSSCITLHNEKVLIDQEKYDDRSYGFARLIFTDNKNNVHMEDIDIIEKNPINLFSKINSLVSKNIEIINFTSSKSKKINLKIPVVLSPRATGYFTHEIIGHILESDFYSFYKEKYKNIKTSKDFIVKDSPAEYNNICGINKYDDIGNKIDSITLIKNGKINNILALDKNESFDNKLYGTARRENLNSEILPRMRATFVLPGNKFNIEQKYSSAIYIEKIYLGGVNPQTGDYNISGNGFYLKNGAKQNFIGNLKVYGNIINDISKVEYIGNDFKMFGAFCKKLEQNIRVGLGGPTISISEMSIEGEIYG